MATIEPLLCIAARGAYYLQGTRRSLMHEMAIAIGIVDAVLDECKARGYAGATAVHVRIGPLSGVDRDALSFAFPLACDGTALNGATLVIEDVPLVIACASCGKDAPPASIQELTCTSCGSLAVRVLQGSELELRAFEVAEGVQT